MQNLQKKICTKISIKITHETARKSRIVPVQGMPELKDSLKHHMKIHKKNAEKPHKCPKCEFSAWRSSNLKTHLKFHEKMEKNLQDFPDTAEKCDKCIRVCKDKKSLSLHMLDCHSEKKFKCDRCGAVLKSKKGFLGHFLTKHAIK